MTLHIDTYEHKDRATGFGVAYRPLKEEECEDHSISFGAAYHALKEVDGGKHKHAAFFALLGILPVDFSSNSFTTYIATHWSPTSDEKSDLVKLADGKLIIKFKGKVFEGPTDKMTDIFKKAFLNFWEQKPDSFKSCLSQLTQLEKKDKAKEKFLHFFKTHTSWTKPTLHGESRKMRDYHTLSEYVLTLNGWEFDRTAGNKEENIEKKAYKSVYELSILVIRKFTLEDFKLVDQFIQKHVIPQCV